MDLRRAERYRRTTELALVLAKAVAQGVGDTQRDQPALVVHFAPKKRLFKHRIVGLR